MAHALMPGLSFPFWMQASESQTLACSVSGKESNITAAEHCLKHFSLSELNRLFPQDNNLFILTVAPPINTYTY